MKKILVATVVLLTLAFSATSAYAHGHGCPGMDRVASYSVCGIESCPEAGPHTHDGVSYSAHSYGDGHDYHSYCGVADCGVAEYHEHNGAYCFGRSANDGHGHHQMRGRH